MSVVDSDERVLPSRTPSEDLNSTVLEVKCGQLIARLHTDKFICPGIHQPCIELDGEMISPKEFTIRANKDKQKDWKGSIRIGKSNMRSLMECKSLDFYNHDTYCSAKCQSRNYITSKNFVGDLSLKPDVFFGASTSNCELSDTNPCGNTVISNALQRLVNNPSALASISIMSDQLILSTLLSSGNSGRTTDGAVLKQEDSVDRSHLTNISRAMQDQPVKFWTMVSDMGLFDEFMNMIITAINQTQRLVSMGSAQRDAVAEKLSQMAKVFELEDIISTRIHAKRLQYLVDTNLLKNKFQAELQRKTEECRRELEEARRRVAQIDEIVLDPLLFPVKRSRLSSTEDVIGGMAKND